MNISLDAYGPIEGSISFSVPKAWLEEKLKELCWGPLDEFLSNYTWDDGEYLLRLAKKDGIIKED